MKAIVMAVIGLVHSFVIRHVYHQGTKIRKKNREFACQTTSSPLITSRIHSQRRQKVVDGDVDNNDETDIESLIHLRHLYLYPRRCHHSNLHARLHFPTELHLSISHTETKAFVVVRGFVNPNFCEESISANQNRRQLVGFSIVNLDDNDTFLQIFQIEN
mmetsp:Transcript_5879/g.14453  ORF Transcript_5879/g.14453 Transcript_5879/m.14453 type:complete len:160 (+) Transcript_5879:188-667(+)